jgi:hypothetical protein
VQLASAPIVNCVVSDIATFLVSEVSGRKLGGL